MRTVQRGSLLIEMMISTVIGALLLSGALTVMLNSRTNYMTRETLSRMEERGHLALALLSEDIRMSGYRGCAADSEEAVTVAIDASYRSWWKPEGGLRGWNFANSSFKTKLDLYNLQDSSFHASSWLPANSTEKPVSSDLVTGSDVLELWVAQPWITHLTATGSTTLMADPKTIGAFPEYTDSDQQRLLLVSDCDRSVLVKAEKFDRKTGQINLDNAVTNSRAVALDSMINAQATVVQGVLYYLATPSGRQRPGLYRREINADGSLDSAVEIVPGILNVQFLYGENTDLDSSANRYVDAEQVTDWNRVNSVRIFVLVESEEKQSSQAPHGFYYFGSDYQAEDSEDHLIRRQFTTTIALRNRALGRSTGL